MKLIPKYLFGSKTKKANQKHQMQLDLQTLYGDKYNESTRKQYEAAYKKNKKQLSEVAEWQRQAKQKNLSSQFISPTVPQVILSNPKEVIQIRKGSSSYDNLTDEELLALNRNLTSEEKDNNIIGITDDGKVINKPTPPPCINCIF